MKTLSIVYHVSSKPDDLNMVQITSDEFKVRHIVTQLRKVINLKQYHYRFKTLCEEVDPKIYAWIDITNINAKAPILQDFIYVKLLEIQDPSLSKITGRMLNIIDQEQNQNYNQSVTKIVKSDQSLDKKQIDSAQDSWKNCNPPPSESYYIQQQAQLNGLLDDIPQGFKNLDIDPVGDFPNLGQPIKFNSSSKPQSAINLWPDDEPIQIKQPDVVEKPKSQFNLWQDDDITSQNLWQPKEDIKSTNQMTREQFKQINQKKVEQAVQEKVDQLKSQWEQENQYHELRQLAKDEIDPKIQQWAYRDNVRQNVRILLSNLNTVLWPEAEWNCSMGDLLSDKKVKIAYHSAIRIVHPDKNHDSPAPQRYTAERVFYELNQAWNQDKTK